MPQPALIKLGQTSAKDWLASFGARRSVRCLQERWSKAGGGPGDGEAGGGGGGGGVMMKGRLLPLCGSGASYCHQQGTRCCITAWESSAECGCLGVGVVRRWPAGNPPFAGSKERAGSCSCEGQQCKCLYICVCDRHGSLVELNCRRTHNGSSILGFCSCLCPFDSGWVGRREGVLWRMGLTSVSIGTCM